MIKKSVIFIWVLLFLIVNFLPAMAGETFTITSKSSGEKWADIELKATKTTAYKETYYCDYVEEYSGYLCYSDIAKVLSEGKGRCVVYVGKKKHGGMSTCSYWLYPKLIMDVPEGWNYSGQLVSIGRTPFSDVGAIGIEKKWTEDYYGDKIAQGEIKIKVQYYKTSQELHQLQRDFDNDYSGWSKKQIKFEGLSADKYTSSYDNFYAIYCSNYYIFTIRSSIEFNKKYNFDKNLMKKEVDNIINNICIMVK